MSVGCTDGRRHASRHVRTARDTYPLLAGAFMATTMLAGLPRPAHAIDWKGSASTDWFVGGNWDGGAVPTAADHVDIDTVVPNATVMNGGNAAAAEIYIGNDATGELTIENGGTLSSGVGLLGFAAGSEGTVTVTGAGSAWNSTTMLIGVLGTGTLTVSDGATVTSAGGVLGFQPGSHGTALLTGGSSWTMTDSFVIGIGTLTVDDGAAVTTANEIYIGATGTGTLTVQGGATVSNANGGIIGFDPGAEGTVTITGPGSLWSSGGALAVGAHGSGSLTVSDGAMVNSPFSVIGAAVDGQGTVTVTDPGSLWTISDDLAIGWDGGDGRLTIDNGGAVNSTGALAMIGTAPGDEGQVTVTGAGSTWSNTGTLTIGNFGSGMLSIVDGGLVTSGGDAWVAREAGSTGRLAIDSQSTLVVGGAYSQGAGSTYAVGLDPTSPAAGLVDVTGLATIGTDTTVEVVRDGSGDFVLNQQYTILTAGGGVTGQYANVTDSLPFIAFAPDYDPNGILLTATPSGTPFADVGWTPNQIETATGAEALGTGNPIHDAVMQLTAPEARAAFDALSGESHASAKGALLSDSRFLREAATGRLRAAFATARQAPVLRLLAAAPAQDVATTPLKGGAFWAKALGSWGRGDEDGNAATLDRSIGGVLLGVDIPVAETWRVGLVTGYSASSLDVDARASSTSVDSVHLGAYGGTEIGPFGLRFGGAYTWHSVDTTRQVDFPGFAETLDSDSDPATAQLFGEAGYKVALDRVALEPFAGLAYVTVDSDGFTETGGEAALRAFGGSDALTYTTLGSRAATRVAVGATTVTARGTLGWRHAFGEVTPTTRSAFAGGAPFTVAGVPLAEDTLVLDAGIDIDLTGNATLGLSYNGQVAADLQDHGVAANLTIRF